MHYISISYSYIAVAGLTLVFQLNEYTTSSETAEHICYKRMKHPVSPSLYMFIK